MNGKNILVISNTEFMGGGEKFLLNTLIKLPHNFHFFVKSLELYNELSKRGFKVEYLSKGGIFAQVQQINKKIRTNHFNSVIFNGGSTLLFSFLIKHNNKILYRHTTYEAYTNKIKRYLTKILTEFNVLYSNKLIHVSKYSYQQQLLQKNKGFVVYHGIERPQEMIKERKETIKVLYVGRLDKTKGLDKIIGAFKSERLKELELIIVGDGSLRNYIENIRYPNIRYEGFHDNPSDYYKQADIFITMPSFEAFGLTILEAMSYGIPVIAPKVGGIPELLNEENGMLITPSIDSIIGAIRSLADNPDLRARKGVMAYTTAKKFDINNTLKKLNELL